MKQVLISVLVGLTFIGFSQDIRINQVGYYPKSEKIADKILQEIKLN